MRQIRENHILREAASRGLSCLVALSLVLGGVALRPHTAAADEPEEVLTELADGADEAATDAGAAGREAPDDVNVPAPAAAEEPATTDEGDEPAADEPAAIPLAAPSAVSPATAGGEEPAQIIVVYEKGASATQQNGVARLLGAPAGETVSFDMGEVALIDVADGMSAEDAAEMAEASDAVKYAVPNYRAELFDKGMAETTANAAMSSVAAKDPYASDQWYLDAIGASGAWNALSGRSVTTPVKVAVLDTGASVSHPDLTGTVNRTLSKEVVWTSRYSRYTLQPLRGDGYTNGSSSIEIASTHGTHVAGIIGAQANSVGVLGVASGGTTTKANKLVDVVAVDIFSENVYIDGELEPNATLYDVVVGLDYARDAGCSVVNMSLGFIETDASLAALMNEICTELVKDDNMVLVCAAGNESTSAPTYPAACTDAIGVISVDEGRMRSSFSNYGSWCDISAPGSDILSTIVRDDKVTNDYGYLSGTSMAAPVVAAAAAMVRAANPDLSASEVRSLLRSTATDLYTAGFDANSGYGLVNAEKAVQEAVRLTTNVWKTVNGKKYYYGADGQPVKWSQKIGGSWYYFNGSGVMQTGWVTWSADGAKSYFDPSTGRAKTGWQQLDGRRYYFDPLTGKSVRWSQEIDGKWYYFNGSSVMSTGLVSWGDGTKSYFGSDGAAAVGWRTVDGATYYFDPSTAVSRRWSQKVGSYWYYFDSLSRRTSGLVTWADGSKSYYDSEGRETAGWVHVGGVWYYFEPMTGKSVRWSRKIGNDWYYFNGASQMQTGWITWGADGTRSYFSPSTGKALLGRQIIGGKVYYFDPLTGKTL